MSVSLLIASNRLPVTVEVAEDAEIATSPSSGGLVSALRGLDEPHLWVGWPGAAVPEERERDVAAALREDGLYPVFLSDADAEGYYTRISNETIWPLLHYFVGRLRFSDDAWASYVAVNDRFADTIASVAAPGARRARGRGGSR